MWEADKAGFNEETPISVQLELPPDIAHKTRVSFDLFAKTPKGPEKISQGEANAQDGSKTPKLVEEMADRLLEVHILQNVTFATGKRFIRTSKAADLNAACIAVISSPSFAVPKA